METSIKNIGSQTRKTRKQTGRYPENGRITLHRILEAFGETPAAHALIRNDLSDPRRGIVISALEALGRAKDAKNLTHIARLLSHDDSTIRLAAPKAIGETGYAPACTTLMEFFKTAGDGRLALETLKNIVKLAPDEPDGVSLLRKYASSANAAREGRAYATGCLLYRGENVEQERIDSVLKECHSNETIFEELLAAVEGRPEIKRRIIDRAVTLRRFLSEKNKATLVAETSPSIHLKASMFSSNHSRKETRRSESPPTGG